MGQELIGHRCLLCRKVYKTRDKAKKHVDRSHTQYVTARHGPGRHVEYIWLDLSFYKGTRMDTKELMERANDVRAFLENRRSPSPSLEQTQADAAKVIFDLSQAVGILGSPSLNDSMQYRYTQEQVKTARAENNAASYKLELLGMKDRCAELMSQHEPINTIGVERELVRQVLKYVLCGRTK